MTRVLVVGAGRTADPSLPILPHTGNDVEAIASVFNSAIEFGDSVETKTALNPSRAQLFEELAWLAEGDGLGVFYFSGHGIRRTSGSSLVVSNEPGSEEANLVSGVDLATRFRYSNQRQLVIVLDCCFAEGIAVEIASGARDGGPSIFALVATDVLTLAHVGESKSAQRVPSARVGLSPFTRALTLALRGLGARPGATAVHLAEVFELISAEAVRGNFPGPAMLRSGTAEEPSLQYLVPRDPRVPGRASWQFEFVPLNVQSADDGPTWVIGSDGARSLSSALAVAGQHVPAVLDGRNAVTLGVSDYRSRVRRPGAILAGIEDPDSDHLSQEVARRDGAVLISRVEPSDNSARVYRVPDVVFDEVLTVFEGQITVKQVDELQDSFDQIRTFSEDSLELARLSAVAVLRTPSTAAPQLADRIRSLMASQLAKPEKRSAYELLGYASGSYLSKERLVRCVAVEHQLTIKAAAHGVDELVAAGLVQQSGRWVRGTAMPSAGGSEHVAEVFRRLAADAITHGTADIRLQTYIAVGALIGREVKQGRVGQTSIELLATYGRDIMDCAGPSNVLSLLNEVIRLRNDDVPSQLLAHRGDALRLMDDYAGAERAFKLALTRSKSDRERARARVGLISAGKNARTDDALLRELVMAISVDPVDNVVPGDSSADRAIAYQLHHAGTVDYARSDWNGAIESFREGLAVLDASDPSHAGVLLDLLKGEADILLHRGEVDAAGVRLSDAFALASESGVVFLDVRAHAKLMQFAGDIARHSCTHSNGNGSRILDVARWWYRRSAETFAGGGLTLGSLISQFRLSQCDVIGEALRDAQFGFTDLWRRFRDVKNPLWEYKCAVMLCITAHLDQTSALPSIGDAAELVSRRLGEKLSPYQQAWGELALAADVREVRNAARLFRGVGASSLADQLENGVDSRIGCHY